MNIDNTYHIFKEGNFQTCIPQFEDYILIEPNDTKALYHLALCYRRLNDHIKSLELMERCYKSDPKNIDVLSERGVGKFHINDKNGALEDMNLCVEKEPFNSYRYSCRAYMKANLNDNNGALEDYQKAIELDPEDVVALNNLGLIEEKIGKIDSSKNRFKQTDALLKGEKFERPDFINELLKDAKPITQEEFELNNRVFEQSKTKSKLNFKSYIDTIKYVIASKEGRKDFFKFLKGKN